jgi:hypothetical protein
MLFRPLKTRPVNVLSAVPALKLSKSVKEDSVAVLELQDGGQLILGPALRFDFESGRTLVLSQGLQKQ